MTTVGLLLISLALKGLAVSIVGAALFLIARRLSASAGASTALSVLTALVMLTALAACPWPHWWNISAGEQLVTRDSQSLTASGQPEAAEIQAPGEAQTNPPAITRPDIQLKSNWQILLESLATGLAGPVERQGPAAPRPATTRAWKWPEVLAIGLLTLAALGFLRLGAGLVGVARLKNKSRPLVDARLQETVDLLRAQLTCKSEVELRESNEIDTPATIGCLRPVLLLPLDWRTWTPAEQQAVLAHELAHVKRGDYPAVLWSQVCLSLNIYNPIAHWLTSRLRLQQELAADACAASLAGGRQPYLVSLAHLALKSDSSPQRYWPVRAFLPGRDSFVRRIQMLRENRGEIRSAPPSWWGRLFNLTALSAVVLAAAGIRGPLSQPPARAQEPSGTATSGAVAPSEVAPARPDMLDLVPDDADMVIILRPAELLKQLGASELMASLGFSPELEKLYGIPPEKMESFAFVWRDLPRNEPIQAPLPPVAIGILRATEPVALASLIAKSIKNPVEIEFAGKKYTRSGVESEKGCVASLDDRTAVFCPSEPGIQRYLASMSRPPRPHVWEEASKRVPPGQFFLATNHTSLFDRLNPLFGGNPQPAGNSLLALFQPLWNQAFAHAISLEATDGIKIHMVAVSTNDQQAERVTETLQAGLTLGRNALEQFKRQARTRPDSALVNWVTVLSPLVDPLLPQARIKRQGNITSLNAATDVTLSDVARAIQPLIVSAQSTREKMMNLNNLRQLGLAMHNHADALGHRPDTNGPSFPPATLLGPDGKTVHSWRVAVLPFLDEQDLYNQYRFDEPWDSEHNKTLIDKMPAVFRHPASDQPPGSTSYLVPHGAGTLFPAGDKGSNFAGIRDGMSNTIMIVEGKIQRPVPWTEPQDLEFEKGDTLPQITGFTPGGFNVTFADGSARFLPSSIDPCRPVSSLHRQWRRSHRSRSPRWQESPSVNPAAVNLRLRLVETLTNRYP